MSDSDLGSVAASVTSADPSLTKVITGASDAAGVAFEAASVEKFKTHKDNPTQIPIGTPVALEATAAALELAPSVEATGDAKAAASGAASKVEEKL